MTLITVQDFIVVFMQSREVSQELFRVIGNALWQNIANFFPTMFGALLEPDWVAFLAYATVLIGSTVLILRIIRKSLLWFFG